MNANSTIRKLWQRTYFLWSGIGLTIVATVLVALRLLWIHLNYPAHFKEITAAYGGADIFYGSPQISHSDRQFTFVKTCDYGIALYLYDLQTGNKKIISIESSLDANRDWPIYGGNPYLIALPWLPDDASFLYASNDWLMTYSLDTEQSTPLLGIPSNSIPNSTPNIVWLAPDKFVYLNRRGTNLFGVEQQADGQWKQHEIWNSRSRMSSLTAIDDDTVAWLEDNIICRANLEQSAAVALNSIMDSQPTNVIAPPTNGLALWLDTSTLHQPNQSSVTYLSDLSPNRNDAFPNGAAPTYNAPNSLSGLLGKGTIHFVMLGSATNGTGLATRAIPGMAGAAPRSVIVVMRHDQDRSMMVNMGDTREKGSLFALEFTNYLYLPTGWKGADNRIKMESTNWNILEAIYDGTTQHGYVNGVHKGTAHAKLNTSAKEVEIGLRTPTAGQDAKAAEGDFAELLIYNHALNADERAQVEDYLGEKWFGLKPRHMVVQNPYVWFDPKVEGIREFSYSQKTREFLINGTQNKHGVLWQSNPKTMNFLPVDSGGASSFESVQWVEGKQWAGIRNDPGHRAVVLSDASGENETRILSDTVINWFQMMPGRQQLLMTGTISNEPSIGIWKYDIATKSAEPIVPYSDKPSYYAKNIIPINETIKSSTGSNLTLTIFTPYNLDPHKKYPLVVGDTTFRGIVDGAHGREWPPCVADSGAYVAFLERPSWWVGIQNWSEDVTSAINVLKKERHIDSNQVYLFASSAETSYMDPIITESPRLWKGIILLDPTGLPDLSGLPWVQQRPKILISAGAVENEEDRFKKYQQEALRSGIMVEYIIHPNEGHNIFGDAAAIKRTRAIMHFIFEE